MTVEPSLLSWATTRPPQDILVTPAQRRWLAAAPAVTGTVGVLVSSLGLLGAARAQALGLAALGTAALVLVVCGSLLTRWWWAGAAALLASLVFGFTALPDQPSAAALLSGGVACALAGAVAHAARAYISPTLLDQVVSSKTAVEFNSFGKPGSPGTLDTAETRMGARMGDDALVLLTWFPAVRTFHGVPFDATGRSTSHVIVCGDKVAVIDCLVWLPGSYSFSSHGALLHNGLHFVYGDVDIHDATRAWRERMGDSVQVRGWFMAGSAHGPVVITDPLGPDSSSGARAGTPQQVLEEVGSWFAEGRTDLVDRRVLFKVAQQLLGS